MPNPFMILSKQSEVVLTRFRWKILISGVTERKTRDYYPLTQTPIKTFYDMSYYDPHFPQKPPFWGHISTGQFFRPKNGFKIGRLESERPLIVVYKSCIVNRQIWVGDSRYVIVFDPLLTGHVIRRMRSGHVRIFNGNQWETL